MVVTPSELFEDKSVAGRLWMVLATHGTTHITHRQLRREYIHHFGVPLAARTISTAIHWLREKGFVSSIKPGYTRALWPKGEGEWELHADEFYDARIPQQ